MNINTNKATSAQIVDFIRAQIPMPATQGAAINTSDVCLLDYRADDNDISSVCNDFGWQYIRLLNEQNEVVPNARLELTYKDGKKVKIVPFFPLVLLAKQATLKLNTYAAMSAWSEQGSLKSRNSYKFVATREQLDALAAKTQMNYEAAIKTTADSFIAWLGEFTPTVEQLPVLWLAYSVHSVIVVLGDSVYVRQVIPIKDTEQQPLQHPALKVANKPTTDKIGDAIISTAYTYILQDVEPVEVQESEEEAA